MRLAWIISLLIIIVQCNANNNDKPKPKSNENNEIDNTFPNLSNDTDPLSQDTSLHTSENDPVASDLEETENAEQSTDEQTKEELQNDQHDEGL